jgi:hypothetical protein
MTAQTPIGKAIGAADGSTRGDLSKSDAWSVGAVAQPPDDQPPTFAI